VKAGVFASIGSLNGMLLAFDVEWLNWSAYRFLLSKGYNGKPSGLPAGFEG